MAIVDQVIQNIINSNFANTTAASILKDVVRLAKAEEDPQQAVADALRSVAALSVIPKGISDELIAFVESGVATKFVKDASSKHGKWWDALRPACWCKA